jgi:hypothetical protein
VFDSEHMLHLCKGHPCTLTVWRQLTDWHEEVTTWRDLRGVLHSHSNIVCLLIQLNYIEFQPLINNLIWVAWLFDHPVLYWYWQMCHLSRFRRETPDFRPFTRSPDLINILPIPPPPKKKFNLWNIIEHSLGHLFVTKHWRNCWH